mmetsp:Transcript_21929/g.36329  ORF Transcript_21929/g.36329 Transcript_21929/m.36329 type:complete len:353 (+) Transcript_21929:170-1228(+)|eukprot:CAMPEP_0184657298 /NCGR_PEP_ID=MMETSP0308-20130426/18439_1 /TAXON_ID=38269 /ORGANISM="Gloeochaete witrockiana, Strain SAG 46.84" /LENGTH=352 /DNA_ID=CAMNT_0027094965 /DNA_START=125 /DNA_END=1183 /DNA_ORIENTATION=-
MGKRSFMVSGNRFDVDERYQLVKPLGHGAYGVVCAAKDDKSGENLAIKKVVKAFDDPTDAKRTLREIRLLSHLNHENVIKLKDIMKPESREFFDDVYLVVELMDTDLHQIIKSPQPLTDDHCQYFLYQILRAIKYIHSAHVLHRDLKPGNLLVNKNCELKVCDFGLARVSDPDEDNGDMTQYVVTRWYRAPELILRGEYTKAIDMWSVGCIFAELLGRKPLFPGRDYIHQLELITKVLGSPSDEELKSINGSEKAVRYLQALPKRPKQSLAKMFPKANPLAIDLLEKMLVFDPKRRCNADEALEHPYLAELHDPNDEPVALQIFTFEFEDKELTRKDLKELIYQECLRFHPD